MGVVWSPAVSCSTQCAFRDYFMAWMQTQFWFKWLGEGWLGGQGDRSGPPVKWLGEQANSNLLWTVHAHKIKLLCPADYSFHLGFSLLRIRRSFYHQICSGGGVNIPFSYKGENCILSNKTFALNCGQGRIASLSRDCNWKYSSGQGLPWVGSLLEVNEWLAGVKWLLRVCSDTWGKEGIVC